MSGDQGTTPPLPLVHRLVCHTCKNETTVAVGDMNPWVVAKFLEFHPAPHHDVRDEPVDLGSRPRG
jgi:hypothetical protein